jgi:uncharacterized membrane protein YebE (DUF533 family)
MLGSVLSGGGSQSGGLGGLLDGLAGSQLQQGGGGGLGGLLNQAMGGQVGGQKMPDPTAEQNTQAEILLRSMINAAKSDGEVDREEQKKILEHLGEVSQDEIDFVQNEMAQSLDVDAFIRSVPRGLEQQVYVMSLLGINLDSQAEAQYLDRLGKGMGISSDVANQIHDKVGLPKLYA